MVCIYAQEDPCDIAFSKVAFIIIAGRPHVFESHIRVRWVFFDGRRETFVLSLDFFDREDNRDIAHFEDARGSSEETDISMGLVFFDNTQVTGKVWSGDIVVYPNTFERRGRTTQTFTTGLFFSGNRGSGGI